MNHTEEPMPRRFAKFAVKTVVMSTAGSVIIKTLHATVPATRDYNIAEITGALGSWMIAEKLQPHTDNLVDVAFDRYEAKKKQNVIVLP